MLIIYFSKKDKQGREAASPGNGVTLLNPWQLMFLQLVPLQQLLLLIRCHDHMLWNLCFNRCSIYYLSVSHIEN